MQLIDLSSGSSFFKSPEQASAAAITYLQKGNTNSYGPSEGSPDLRNAIVERYRQKDISIEPEQVMISPGSKYALYIIFSILLSEGDEVVIPTPSWFGFHDLLKNSKGKLVTVQTTLSDHYKLDPETLREVLHPGSRILVLTNPGNPTGHIYSKQELEAILTIASEFPYLYIISDEIYDFITYSSPFTSILSCQGPRERCLVVNGFSKSFAMTSWRIGYIVGSEEIIQQCTSFQASTISGVSPFVQAGAMATIKDSKNVLAPMLEVLLKNRKIGIEALKAIPQVKFHIPEGAYYFFPDLSFYFGKQKPDGESIKNSVDLGHYLRTTYKLEVLPGDYFGCPGHVRMSFAVDQVLLQQALERLKQALATLV